MAGLLDTCGTGGDGLATFNISTTTAFVVAGAGVPVAKHGNRAVSSRSGSADVLEALGVRIDLAPDEMARCIDEVGVGFLFAQSLHASMRHAGGPRREIAIRTVFNILGPLTNPAGAKRQLLGVYDPALAPVMAEVAGRLGCRARHGRARASGHRRGVGVRARRRSPSSSTARSGPTRSTPSRSASPLGSFPAIAGGDAARNAAIVRAVLAGEHGAPRDVVLMNAAAALLVAGAVDDLAEGVAAARSSHRLRPGARARSRRSPLSRSVSELEADARKEAGAVTGATDSFLERMVVARRRSEIAARYGALSAGRPRASRVLRARSAATSPPPCSTTGAVAVIAEVKKASPSAGPIALDAEALQASLCTTRTAARRRSAC